MSPAADASPHDLSRAGAANRQARKLRWGAVGLVLLMLGVGALVAATERTSVARAFGNATEVTAVIDTVALSSPQPRKKSRGPQWILTFHWVDPTGEVESGSSRLRSREQPFVAGDTLSIFVTDGPSDVSLGRNSDGAAVWVLIGTIIGSFGVAWGMVRYARRWKQLITVPDQRGPRRLRVTGVRSMRRTSAVALEYRPVSGVRFPGEFRLHRQPPFVLPVVDEKLDVWSWRDDGRGPLLVRQDDGTWSAASGSLH